MKASLSLLGVAIGLVFSGSALADNVTFLQTRTTSSDYTVSYDSSTGVLSASDVPIYADTLGGADENATFSFSADLDTTGVGSIFDGAVLVDDATNVQFSINDGGTNILSGVATSAGLTETGDQFALSAQNPTDGVNFSSDVFDSSVYMPENFQILFEDTENPISVSDGNFNDFRAQLGTSGYTADVATPLPKSALAGTALLGVLGLSQLKRQRRNQPVV